MNKKKNCMLVKVIQKLINYYKRRNHVQYAVQLGVKVGENCRFVDNPCWGSEPYLISIGDHVLISSQVAFLTHDGATWCFREESRYKDTYKFGSIRVGNNCFIGFRSIILPDVDIGDNSIIAAGSIVTKSVPSGEVWGGVPAHFLMSTEEYSEKCLKNRLSYDAEKMKTDPKNEMLCAVGKRLKDRT